MTTIKLDKEYIFQPEYPTEFEGIDYAKPGAVVKVLASYGKSGDEEIFYVMFDGDIDRLLMVGEYDLRPVLFVPEVHTVAQARPEQAALWD
jgi:hypothetical protein